MTWVKLCGMTNLEDALVAVDAGADAVGFVFYEKSPRCVTVETAREICAKLPESVEKIGVFVGNDGDPIRVMLNAGLTGTQTYLFSGSSLKPAKATGRSILPPNARFIMALSMGVFDNPAGQVEAMVTGLAKLREKSPAGSTSGFFDTFLFDSGSVGQPGGTGKSFDWAQAGPVSESMRSNGMKLVVAGGLNSENVGEAIRVLKPWGVDVVSGVEAHPGKKDPEKVRAFVRAVREMDARIA
jgi:phosphoribosylanthranilate isomerase